MLIKISEYLQILVWKLQSQQSAKNTKIVTCQAYADVQDGT